MEKQAQWLRVRKLMAKQAGVLANELNWQLHSDYLDAKIKEPYLTWVEKELTREPIRP